MRRTPFLAVLVATAVLAGCGSDDDSSAASSDDTVASSTATTAASTTTIAPTTTKAGQEVNATAAGATPSVGNPICDDAEHCIYPLTITATMSGDLSGTTISHSAGVLAGTDFAASDTLLFTGTVAGCGTGTLVLLSTGRGSTTGGTTSSWTIAEGFGTGDLVNVSGSGTNTVPPPSSGDATTITGRIACS